MHSDQSADNPLHVVRRQLQWARDYTLGLLDDISDDEFFVIPPGNVSHIAWQMGHIAMAEYGLTILRIRGKQSEHAEFITNDFIRTFKKGSHPSPDVGDYPSATTIRQVFADVHEHAMVAISTYSLEELSESLPAPTAAYETKLGSLFMCVMHEMLHAGQIGTIRRGLGKSPVR